MRLNSQIRFVLPLALTLACVPAVSSRAEAPQESAARAEIERLIQKEGADVAVAFRSLDGTQELFIQPDKQFPAADAIIKIPVMIELYAQAQAGELRLSDAVPVHTNFRSLVDGKVYRLDPKDDSDLDVYNAPGKTMTLRDLCEHMIAGNNNLAANLLIEKLGAGRIRQRLQSLHADGVQFVRGFEPAKPNNQGPVNTTSARGLMELLWALAKGEVVSPDASDEMIGMMARAALHQGGAAGPPPDTHGAHTTVAISGTHHQALIVYGAHSFVLAILVRNITDPERSSALMAQIAHALIAGAW